MHACIKDKREYTTSTHKKQSKAACYELNLGQFVIARLSFLQIEVGSDFETNKTQVLRPGKHLFP